MPAAMVAHRAADGLGQLVQARHQRFDGLIGAKPRPFQRGIQAVDVGLMVLAVVDLHRHRVDVGLQGVIGVRQGGKGVGHADSPFRLPRERFMCQRASGLPDGGSERDGNLKPFCAKPKYIMIILMI
ncbi:hypothetical protein D9M68_937250 [compost metagenome]